MPSKELSAVAIQRHTPLYLTNALCEHAHGNPVLFKSLGLPSGEWRGSFYPLTTQEAIFVGDDSESFGDATLLFGYSVLLEGQKWVAPSVEFHYRTSQNPAAPTCARVEAKARAFLAAIEAGVQRLGGRVRLDLEDGVAHHTVVLLVPMESAIRFATYARWRACVVDVVGQAMKKANAA